MNNEQKPLQLADIYIKDFRCFNTVTINLDNPIILIYGQNGIGKTSLLEALYYACYLRSFRTRNPRDLVALTKDSFFITLRVHDKLSHDSLTHTISVGFSDNKRLVKINNQATTSYKDLLSYYRVVGLTEDDLMLIKGSPEERRAFVDQALLLKNSHFLAKTKEFRVILDNRNALLNNGSFDKEEYAIWTQKLWTITRELQDMRIQLLKELEHDINHMLATHIDPDIAVTFNYQAKKSSGLPFKEFLEKNADLLADEIRFQRSLFGAHLDEFIITFEGKKSRAYASRGQQKMVLLLIKTAQIKQLIKEKGPVIFLLDDFMTDFDAQRSELLLPVLLDLDCQLIFTSPHTNSPLEKALNASGRNYKTITM